MSTIQVSLRETFPRAETKIVPGSNNSILKVAGGLVYVSKISSKPQRPSKPQMEQSLSHQRLIHSHQNVMCGF